MTFSAGAIFLLLAPLLALLDWWALWHGKKRLDYLAKPGVILALLGALALLTRQPGTGLRTAFLAGLLLSLAGDVGLMLPRERFLLGLVAFLLAHLAYAAGLVAPPLALPSVSLAAVAGVGALGIWLFRRIRSGLRASHKEGLLGPLLAYSIVISLMLITALLTLVQPDWGLQAAVWVAVGASLFYVSDALLAWNRFVRPVPRGRLKVRILYHTGQISLTAGVILHLLTS